MRRVLIHACLAFAFLCSANVAGAVVPDKINVQGRLTDLSGVPLSPGIKTLSFSIWDAEAGGAKLWPDASTEDQVVTTGSDGLWTAFIGALQPLTPDIFADTTCWLEIAVDDGANPLVTLPRVRFVTGPYAFRVETVDGASGGHISGKLNVGTLNANPGSNAFVLGSSNNAQGDNTVVVGGEFNQATIGPSAVVGGSYNVASGTHSFVTGSGNHAAGAWSTVTGGNGNFASGSYSAISGGSSNGASGTRTFVGAGNQNAASGANAAVVGGSLNDASGEAAFIGAGAFNQATGDYAVVAGGGGDLEVDSNVASGTRSVIGGGRRNRAAGGHSTIGGGFQNRALELNSAVLGGTANSALDTSATVGGGSANYADAPNATVGGGASNGASGRYACVPGGYFNIASGNYSFAAGANARAANSGTFVWSDFSSGLLFQSTGANQFLIRATGGVGIGTNNPEAPLHVMESSIGSVTATPVASAVFERNGQNFLHVLAHQDSACGILFGSAASSLQGSIRFNPPGAGKGFHFRCGNNDIRLVLDSLGNLSADGCVSGSNIACVSDSRLKKNVRPLGNSLGEIDRLRGVRYEWRRDEFPERGLPEGGQIGLLAQDVREVVPEAVIEQPDGYLAVDYTRLVPLLIEAVKAQQQHIEDLEKAVANMRP